MKGVSQDYIAMNGNTQTMCPLSRLQYVHRSVGEVCFKKRGDKLYYIYIVSYLHTIYNYNSYILY